MSFYKFKYIRNGTTYIHDLPNPVSCDIDEERVAKEGSGRGGNCGTMAIEYLGLQTAVSVYWDLLPNTKDYINLYRILESLPPFFTFIFPSPNGNNAEEIECYNSKWRVSTFKIKGNNTYFRGLTTSFISKDLKKLRNVEPELIE